MTTETRFHRHWYIYISKQGWWYRFLRKPRLRTTDKERAEKSMLVWGVSVYRHGVVYELTILGILHSLTGLTLQWKQDREEDRE